ncbi:type VI secretion system contractile sheath small subunit [Exilibacterium tricleocarpae]|uniref:Type VI secretion system contractile sheath small subunit n=1 Tax=Exilibacterium tricleocarpae TaxID=2591008 RepID=A0A545SPJ2_9GAMM|nr:type VI secretion system contractile sheath small subunit [Exilibacterium tricleocarpae]TQV66912.1 type VI secretion system contractile sheath small subunit [Exilibacterium tricleocarpae]
MSESIHDKLKRVRKPRVHITYDVETNGAEEKKELPFVVGVMGDYSGDNTENKKSVKERKFVQIDRDNFNEAMGKINPKLQMKVENTLAGDDSEMSVNLDFNSMDDFEPQNIVKKVEPLKQLMDARNKLRDLLSKADRSEELEGVLEEVLQSTEKITELGKELGIEEDKGGDK